LLDISCSLECSVSTCCRDGYQHPGSEACLPEAFPLLRSGTVLGTVRDTCVEIKRISSTVDKVLNPLEIILSRKHTRVRWIRIRVVAQNSGTGALV
jgi:hypothetical protein